MVGVAIPDDLRMRFPYHFEELAACQVDSILKCQSDGPYFVAGFSAEGVLAYEVAQQLRAKGRTVGLLVMLDSRCPNQPRPSWFVRKALDVRSFPRKFQCKRISDSCHSLRLRP